jgi:hypothetical protein
MLTPAPCPLLQADADLPPLEEDAGEESTRMEEVD